MDTDEARNVAALKAFGVAGDRHDIDAMMAQMTDDCVFDSSFGPEVHGTRYSGQDQVRQGLKTFLDRSTDGKWTNPNHFVSGDRGVAEWTFTGTDPDGSAVEVNGCDVITFRDGKIAVKDSFRKNRTAPEG
ncbi:MAG: nuclear transport factor 2 family protein [Myxococcota bacterium]|nr:nuclear transport factor 2 family protein [Myxococcota bacterium]